MEMCSRNAMAEDERVEREERAKMEFESDEEDIDRDHTGGNLTEDLLS